MIKKINYSLIIPHKNRIDLLKRCLDSIPFRDDIEIIIIDDNSDPDIIDFNNFPGKNISNIKIILTKEGKGAGYARNIGLKIALGYWLIFADSDDYFADNFMDHFDKYLNSNYDMIYFGIYRINKENENNNIICNKYDDLMYDAINNKNYDAYKYTAYVPWGKIIKKNMIVDNNILFDETIVANDRMFSLKTAYHAKNIFFDQTKIYVYNPEDSYLTKINSIQADFDRFFVYIRINSFLNDINKKKYKVNILPLLKKIILQLSFIYFYKVIYLLIKYKINLINEYNNFYIKNEIN